MDWYELLLVIGAWGLLGAVVLFVCSHLFGGRPICSVAIGVFLAGFVARVLVIMLNEEFVFFDPKLAGNRSLELFQYYIVDGHGWLGLCGEEFAAQVVINVPVWLLFGASRLALLFSNAAIGALAAPVAAVLLLKDFGNPAAKRALILLSLYPGGFNFSVFGLRDPIIFLAVIVMIVGGMRIWTSGIQLQHLWLVGVGTIFTLWLRPELAYVVLVFYLIPVINGYINLLSGALVSRRALVSLLLLTVPLMAVGTAAAMAATGVVGRNIGVNTLNPADIADQSAENRFARHESGLGGGSHIVSASIYSRLPWYFRVPLQTAGLILLPFPWQVTSIPRLLAFGDSLLLIVIGLFVIANAWFSHPLRNAGVGRLALFLMLISLIGFLGLGFVISNFGNGFRMRLAVTPMIFLAASVCPIRVRFRLRAPRNRQAFVTAGPM